MIFRAETQATVTTATESPSQGVGQVCGLRLELPSLEFYQINRAFLFKELGL